MTRFPLRRTAVSLSAIALSGGLLLPALLGPQPGRAIAPAGRPQAQWQMPDPNSPPFDRPQIQPPGGSQPQIQPQQQVIHVDANVGRDDNPGTFGAPLRTATAALSRASYGVAVKLSPGTYSTETGERFPLVVPSGVKLGGSSNARGSGIAIVGGGRYLSRSFAGQEVAVVLEDGAIADGLTISNPNVRGTGLWVEGGAATIANCTFSGSHRDGVFVTGNATAVLENNTFQNNGGNGLSITRSARPIVRGNTFEATGFGITIGDNAQPLLQNNRIINNTDGAIVTRNAHPIFRGNEITGNRRDGVVAISQADPDLGTFANPGNNRIMGNGRYAIYNATQGNTISAVGNQIDSTAVNGAVTLAAIAPEWQLAVWPLGWSRRGGQ